MLIVLAFYILFLLVFGIFSAIALYHLWEFGYIGDATKKVMYIYVLISTIIIILTIFLVVI